jgi:hypothetical protein
LEFTDGTLVSGESFEPFNKTSKAEAVKTLNTSMEPFRELSPNTGAYVNEVRLSHRWTELMLTCTRLFLSNQIGSMPFGVTTTRNFCRSRRVLILMMFCGVFLVLEVRSGNRRTMVVFVESNESVIGNVGGELSLLWKPMTSDSLYLQLWFANSDKW